MAYYAELKRRQWRCINGVNMITEYQKYLYETWYNSLSDEQKENIEKEKQQRMNKAEKELETSIVMLVLLEKTLSSLYDRKNNDKYHGIYDEFGFPII